MIKITGALLERLTGGHARDSFVDEIADAMNEFFPQYDITTELRIEHFLAQAAHESDSFKTLYEYWGPTKAQRGYEGRKDLGNSQKGDGHRYRGRGIFQLTGRANYRDIGKALGLPLEKQPDLAADPRNAVHIACKFWGDRDLNDLADADNVTAITRRINGGTNGLADRRAKLASAKKLIKRSQSVKAPDPSLPLAGGSEVTGAPDFGPDEVILTPSSPKDLISALQKLLNEKNYGKLNPDGDWGQLTSMAVLALQEANSLSLNGAAISFEDAKDAKVFIPEARKDATITEIRASDTEAKKEIKKTDVVEVAGYAVGGVVAGDKVGFWDGVGTWIDKLTGISGALQPLSGMGDFLQANWGWVLVGGAGVAIFMARQSKWSILKAFQRGD